MRSDTKNTVLFTALLFIGLFFPTSLNGVIQNLFVPIGTIIGILLVISFIKFQLSGNNILIFILINFCLIAFTFSSEFSQKSYGVYPNFLFLSLLFLLDLRQIELKLIIKKAFLIASFSIIILGIGVVFKIKPITNLIINFYSASYDDLVPRMVFFLKPVATFGTHSVGGIFLFLFFYLNFISFKVFKKRIYLINSIIFLLLLVFIRSNTAFFYLVIALALIIPSLKKVKIKFVVIIVLSLIGFLILILQYIDLSALDKILDVESTLTSDSNGLKGRFSNESPLMPTINYILEHPFSPIGLSYSKALYYTDSGFILYVLRGSVVLMAMIYLGFIRTVSFNIKNKKIGYFLLFSLLIFEIGYPILINFRMLFFIPFAIVYLNFLETQKHAH